MASINDSTDQKKKADPRYSAGARVERASILAHVRREQRAFAVDDRFSSVLANLEDWILKRRARYEKKAGGLGRK